MVLNLLPATFDSFFLCIYNNKKIISFQYHFEILGCPIGDYIYCATFIASKRLQAHKLLLQLKDVAATDPQVALTLLRLCGSFFAG